MSDLAFWDRNNTLFYHPYCLHSVGQYRVGSVIDNALTRGGRTDRVLVGDSGGFQIGKGTLKGYDALKTGMSAHDAEAAWVNADEVRNWIITWLETNCQYAMTLDMPLWATTSDGADSPFHQCSVEQLTAMTVENLRYIESNRQGKTLWLNVVQGLDESSTKAWFDAVKWFRYGGWALAGNAGAGGCKGPGNGRANAAGATCDQYFSHCFHDALPLAGFKCSGRSPPRPVGRVNNTK